MRIFIGLLAGALLTVAGCGTYRSAVGHQKPDAVVQAIAPTSGESGESVTFQAQVCTKFNTTAPTLTWNFGGGADPNTSFDESPQVVLTAGGTYNAALTLTGGCLGANLSATYPFTLSVAPLTILAISGTTGISTKNGALTAVIGTGVPTTFAWDLGGAGTITGNANTSTPTITWGAPGIYTGHVIVTNDYEAVQQDFTINIV
jgi:PKD repeat protein